MKLKTIVNFTLALCVIVCLLPSCKQEKKYKIGVSQCSSDDWREKMNEEIMREAMFHDNVEIEIRSAGDSNAKQIEDIRYFADNGFDIIIAAPNEAGPVTPVIDEVMGRGIPVMIFDRSVTGDNFTAFQGADNDSIGFEAGRYILSAAGPRARIIEIFGNPGSTPAVERHQGLIDALGDVRPIASGVGNWNYNPALHVADSLLKLYPDADAVFAHNDRMAIAAADAARNLGLHPLIVGIDAAPSIGMKAVADGKIDATFVYPTEGYQLIRTALAILEGKPYKKITLLPAVSAVDKSNADILILQNEALNEETSKITDLKSQVDFYWSQHTVQTIFLYIILVILFLLFIFLFLFLRSYWQKQRQQRQLVAQNAELERQRDNEKRLNEEIQAATRSKLTFFTNVSHDLRTPLTLIAEPVRQLSTASNLDASQQSLMKIADKNVRLLQRLINQVLDFRKYENGKMELVLSEVDICVLIEDWTEAFRDHARRHDIKLSLSMPDTGTMHFAIDVAKIESVMFNLLSNAFKYTPDNGTIAVSVKFSDESCTISIKDSGKGIPPEDIAHIFDRFYQVEKKHPTGSGIGLSVARAFVELHGGALEVESEPGKGSDFMVTLPLRHVSGKDDHHISSHLSSTDVAAELSRLNPAVNSSPAVANEDGAPEALPIVLVIDDNQDILTMLTQVLSDRYRVVVAGEGAEGIRLAAKYVPDVIICDVMMPGIDGLECCRRIKSESTTSHIPVLMLTACNMDEQRVQSYESGADGYISKPFNAGVLLARIKNLIDNRRIISATSRQRVSKAEIAEANQPELSASNVIDNEFFNKFLDIFRQKMSNPDVNVDTIAAELGFGRSQFYRKIKALTNYSPVELLRKIRLETARNLLLRTEKSVSEIAYEVGFSTPAYFSKCYREAYGETPSETRTKLTS